MLGWIIVVVFVLFYTGITLVDYLPPPPIEVQEWIRRKRFWKRRVGPQDVVGEGEGVVQADGNMTVFGMGGLYTNDQTWRRQQVSRHFFLKKIVYKHSLHPCRSDTTSKSHGI